MRTSPASLRTRNSYGGDGACLALYVTDSCGACAGSLWMAGDKPKDDEHLSDWYRATGGDTAQINGITGASARRSCSLHCATDGTSCVAPRRIWWMEA